MPNPVAGACGFVGIMISVPALIAIFVLGKTNKSASLLHLFLVIRHLRVCDRRSKLVCGTNM